MDEFRLKCNNHFISLIQRSVYTIIYDEMPCLPSEQYVEKYDEMVTNMLESETFSDRINRRFYQLAQQYTGYDIRDYTYLDIRVDTSTIKPVVIHHLDQAIIKFFYKNINIDLVFPSKRQFKYLKLLNDVHLNNFFNSYFISNR
ncbi:hypothetical protein PBI_SCTP2_271 [Salicola phage SCTP-2]|nr:hypothetical protein PBI_SCTP2_271 [Salicola phage SCTP-2]